ncbi:hypothetical protein FQR65_LT20480 [Abscondita terminalis]|nr:hypothetical protein FQR65_LT20480 [Abscondita terminalis]
MRPGEAARPKRCRRNAIQTNLFFSPELMNLVPLLDGWKFNRAFRPESISVTESIVDDIGPPGTAVYVVLARWPRKPVPVWAWCASSGRSKSVCRWLKVEEG